MKRLRNSGFTLLELIITVSIIAVVVTIGVPSFNNTIMTKQLKEPVEKLYADLLLLKTETLKSKNISGHIYFNTGDGGAWCYGFKLTNDNTETCDCFKKGSGDPTEDKKDSSLCQIYGKIAAVSNADFSERVLASILPAKDRRYRFDPVRGLVYDGTGIGNYTVEFQHKKDANLKVQVVVSRLGRLKTCSPTGSTIKDYPQC